MGGVRHVIVVILTAQLFSPWIPPAALAQTQQPLQAVPPLPLSQTEGDWERAREQLVFAFDRLVPHRADMVQTRMRRSGLLTLMSVINKQSFQPPPPEQIIARAIADMEVFGTRTRLPGRDALISLFEVAAAGLVTAADPHAHYIPPLASRDRRARLFGEVLGIGLNLEPVADGLRVNKVAPMRRAARAGILAGDVMLGIGNASLADMDIETAAILLDSLAGQDLLATVRRPGQAGLLHLPLPRDSVNGVSSESWRIGDIIYIKLHSFGDDASEMIEREIVFSGGVNRSGSRGVILDLRGNGGGFLDQGAMAANAFLDSGIIVTVIDTNPARSVVYSAQAGDLAEALPMVVMIDRFTASAAEMVAAALQDHRRALVVGAPSTGKGTVQTVYSVGMFGSVSLTTGRFFRPSGAWLQDNPVTPDLILDGEAKGAPAVRPQDCPPVAAVKDPWIACATGVLVSQSVKTFLGTQMRRGPVFTADP